MELCALLVRSGVVASRAVVVRYAHEAIDGYARRGGLPLARRGSAVLGRVLGLMFAVLVAHLRWWSGGRRGPSPQEARVVTATLANYVANSYAVTLEANRAAAIQQIVLPLWAIATPVGRVSAGMFDACAAIETGRWDEALRHLGEALESFEHLDDRAMPRSIVGWRSAGPGRCRR